mgnify:CR=1 FL=1
MAHYCGIDFGTSNSVVTVLADDPREDAADRGGIREPVVLREPSLMFFADDPESTTSRYCGERALAEYVSSGMRGRFFQSVKSILPDPGFTTTRVNGKPFTAEDLVAVMLRFLREEAERRAGVPIRRAVVGRPARFSDDPERETLAQQRLERAVGQAGIEEARYELEPVAGAYAYARTASANGGSIAAGTPTTGTPGASAASCGVVLVADHGGGTSDFTLLELGAEQDGRLRAERILATHGVRAGGDDFDGAIMWNRLVGQFGYGTHYESFGRMLPVPVHIFHIISRWDRIHFLKTLSYREELKTYLRSSDNPIPIRRLIKLVEEDLGYFIFRAIEGAKIDLSSGEHSSIDYEHGKLRIHEAITRQEFESYIADHVARIRAAVDETLTLAGNPAVSTAFLTGGSSRVPAVRGVLAELVGEDRVVDDTDRFQSVSLGLSLAARDRGLTTVTTEE